MSTVVVHAAGAGDFHAVGTVHAASRRAAYRDLLAPGTLAAITAESQAMYWRSRMSVEPRPHLLAVAETDGTVVGFCLVSGGTGERDGDTDAVLSAVHVHPDRQGAGTGRLLIETARARALDWRRRTLRLWVLEGNARARRVYEHLGWIADDITRGGTINGEPTTQVRYSLVL
jgi:GNAT superfamily N-acetyltransferase